MFLKDFFCVLQVVISFCFVGQCMRSLSFFFLSLTGPYLGKGMINTLYDVPVGAIYR